MIRFLRYLRIAFSATCVLVAVLLCALWVRSYWRGDALTYWGWRYADVSSSSGYVGFTQRPNYNFNLSPRWKYRNFPARDTHHFQWVWESDFIGIRVPMWLLVIPFSTVAAISWVYKPAWRFSLRTLLLATTLVALGLGLFVWLR